MPKFDASHDPSPSRMPMCSRAVSPTVPQTSEQRQGSKSSKPVRADVPSHREEDPCGRVHFTFLNRGYGQKPRCTLETAGKLEEEANRRTSLPIVLCCSAAPGCITTACFNLPPHLTTILRNTLIGRLRELKTRERGERWLDLSKISRLTNHMSYSATTNQHPDSASVTSLPISCDARHPDLHVLIVEQTRGTGEEALDPGVLKCGLR
ncbi:hypothetical protein BGZ60DRAFT_530534 [Tricladium varicosporioides]|nr:hypothetical protein BGZ60DRAFT_530534 [Hymenoscyphus varicosporioides]